MQNETKIDGQEMLILSDDEWTVALNEGRWGQLSLYSPETKPIIVVMLNFARTHRNSFQLALCKDGPFTKVWTPINLLRLQGRWRRVHIERVQCTTCRTAHLIANPTVADLYLGVADWANAMRQASTEKQIPCKRCQKELPRFAIWAEIIQNA